MAVKYTRNTTDKFVAKGILNENATTLTYESKDTGDVEIVLKDYFEQFASQPVEISIKTTMDQELYLPEEEGM